MTARHGEIKGRELWLRCPFCGDSERHRTKAHFSINDEGLYHCLRCAAGGRFSGKQFLQLALRYGFSITPRDDDRTRPREEEVLEVYDQLMPGAATPRYSALDRFHWGTDDVFLARNAHGELKGLAIVSTTKRHRRIIGQRALGWSGAALLSTPESPLRVVEGPYDVIDQRHVCVFGLPTFRKLAMLRGQFLILCPDGDVWSDSDKVRSLDRTIRRIKRKGSPHLLGIEVLPDGKDPDEIPVEDRHFVTV